MKKINLFSRLWSSGGNSQSSDVGYDSRLTVGSPSGIKSSKVLKFVSVLVLILTIGSGNVWGLTETITLSDFGWSNASTQSSITATTATIALAKNSGSTTPTYYTSDGLRIYGVASKTTGGTISFTPKTGITISKIAFTHTSSNSGVLSIKSGGGSYSSKTWSGTLAAGSTLTLVATNSGTKAPQVRITKIVITYTAAASYTVTATRNDNSYGTVSVSGTTITATPSTCYQVASGASGYTVTSGTATVSHDGNSNTLTVTPSSNCTVQVNFEKKTVNTYVDEIQGNSDIEDCGTHDAPLLDDKAVASSGTCAQQHWHFMGWVTAANKATPTDLNIIAPGTEMTASGATYYAVWAKGTSGGGFDNSAGGTFKIYADVSGTKYYATGTGSKITASTDASDAAEYVFEKQSAGVYYIKTGTDYITYSSSTNLGTSASGYSWTVTAGTKGSWRLTSETSGRGFIFRSGTGFGGYSTSNVTAGGTEYYDVEIGGGYEYSDYMCTCCTSLASINGSVNWSNPTTAVVTWNKLADQVTSWALSWSPNTAGSSITSAIADAGGGTQKTATVSDLACNTAYTFTLTPTLKSGVCTPASNPTIESTSTKWTITKGSETGGTFTVGASSSCSGSSISISATPSTGYQFSSWTIDKAGGGTVTPAASSATTSFTMPSDNVTVTANFICVATTATVAPTSAAGNYGWRYTTGETIDLTCSTTGATPTGYQWQKYVGSEWTDINTATNASAGTARLQIASCTSSDGGSYRCVVTTGTGCSFESDGGDGYFVRVFTFNGNYSGSGFSENAIAWTGEYTGTVTLSLTESSIYEFKVYDNNGKTFGNGTNNYIIQPVNWNCGINNSNCRLFTGPAGSYTFTLDVTNAGAGSPYVNVQVAYPSVSHPAAGYVYVSKWWNCYPHFWDGSSNPLTPDGYDPQIETYTTICENDYWYFPLLNTYVNVAVKDNATWASAGNNSGNQTMTGQSGKYLTHDGSSWDWHDFATYTISFAGNGNDGGSMSNVNGVCPNANRTLAANGYSKTGYHFDGWKTNTAITINTGGEDEAVNVNGIVPDEATIKSINNNITLTAQWAANTNTPYVVKHYKQKLDGTYPASPDETDNLTGTTGASVTPARKSYTGFTAPAGQTVTILADGSRVVTYNYTRNSYTLAWALDGGSISSAGTAAGSVKYGASLTAPTVTKTGYTFSSWSPSVPGTMPAANSTYTATWTANTNTAYTVKHYQQKLDGTYPSTPTETQNLTGTTATSVTPAVKSYTGFTAPSTQTKTIAADGSMVIEYNYTRNSYTLTWVLNGGKVTTAGTCAAEDATGSPYGSVKFGASITVPVVAKTGYNMTWSSSPAATMPAGNTTYTANWNTVSYTITYNDLEGATNSNPANYTIESSAITLVYPGTREGYTFAGWYTNSSKTTPAGSPAIAAGSTGNKTFWAKWDRNYYTITWHVGASTSTTEDVEHGTTFSALDPESDAPAHADNALSACGSTKFIGWVKASGAYTDDGKTVDWYNTHKANASDAITDNTDYYAMYAEAEGAEIYSRVTSDLGATNWAGDYLIAYSSTKFADGRIGGTSGMGANGAAVNPDTKLGTLVDTVNLAWGNTYNVTLELIDNSTNTYVLKTKDGNYNYQSSNSNGLLSTATKATAANYPISVTFTSSSDIKLALGGGAAGAVFRYNTDGYFRYYKNGGQNAVYLYKKTQTLINYRTGCSVTCSRPTVNAPASVTKTSATISWAAGSTGTPESYEYKVWEDGTDEPVSGTTTTGTSVNLTGLYSGVTYHWKVKADCGDVDGESIWATGTNFTTTAAALTYSVPDGVSAVTTPATTAGDLNSAEVPTSCGSCWAFVGWTTAAYAENSSAPATLFPAGTKAKVSGDATLHAVYGKVRYQLIGETSDLEANADYILTSLYNDHEYALTATVGSGANYAASTDVTSQVQETPEGYFLYNPNATNIWKFTGTAASGRLYNATNAKYVDLSAVPVLKDATSDNLAFTNPDPEDAAFNIASTTTSSNKLHRWDDLDWGISSTVTDVYMYQLESSAYATTPDCRTFTVTWDVNNGATTSTSNVTKCQGYLASLPSAPANNTLSSCQTNGKFVGWSPTKVMPAQDIVPTGMFNDVDYSPEITQDTTFYAVFAEEHSGSVAATSKTYTFTSASWGDDEEAWSSGKAGNALTSGRGIQVTKLASGANATTKSSYDDVTSVVVTYSTNASSGEGSIAIEVNGTAYSGGAVTTSGGTSDRTLTFTPPSTALDGAVKITVTCTTNSIYIKSVQIFYTGSTTTYDQYRTACCTDPQLKFLDGEGDPTTEYVIVREDLASASAPVEIACDISSLNTTGTISWSSTHRDKNDYASAHTWSGSQAVNLNIDIANEKITAKETGVWQITISQAAGATTYCPVDATVTIRVKTIDKFIDAVNGNFSGEPQSLEDTGNGILLPTEAMFSTNNGCVDGTTRRLIGWIKASDLATYASGRRVDMIDDLKTGDASNKVIAPGTKIQATGITWYAVWGVEK